MTNTEIMTNTEAQNYIDKALQRRFDLVENEEFRKAAVELAKKLGVTAKEWNENKIDILLHFANEYCGIEDSEGVKGRFTA